MVYKQPLYSYTTLKNRGYLETQNDFDTKELNFV